MEPAEKGISQKKDEIAYKQAKEEIEGFEKQAEEGKLDIYYFDASGFDLTPPVPYRGQAGNTMVIIPSSPSKRIKVLGFLNTLIEILWRNMKYRWLPIWAYESVNTLKLAIEDILINYGSKYLICFA